MVGPVTLENACHSIFLGHSHWSLIGRFGIIEAPACNEYHTKDFLVAISWGSQKEAHGSQCEVQGSQNSPSLRL